MSSPSTARAASGTRRILDIEQALFVCVRDGLWTEVRALPLDPEAFDRFWA